MTNPKISVFYNVLIIFEYFDGNEQLSAVFPGFYVEVKTNGAGGDPHHLCGATTNINLYVEAIAVYQGNHQDNINFH